MKGYAITYFLKLVSIISLKLTTKLEWKRSLYISVIIATPLVIDYTYTYKTHKHIHTHTLYTVLQTHSHPEAKVLGRKKKTNQGDTEFDTKIIRNCELPEIKGELLLHLWEFLCPAGYNLWVSGMGTVMVPTVAGGFIGKLVIYYKKGEM